MLWQKDSNSGENRVCKKQNEPQGLACFYLHRYDPFRGRDHPYLWETLADRGFLQNL